MRWPNEGAILLQGKVDLVMGRESGLDLVMIDYLQLIRVDRKRGESTNDMLEGLSRGLKMLAFTDARLATLTGRTEDNVRRARINLGIRRRLAPLLGDRRRLELLNALLFSLPGTPVLYYGDEIGMGDNIYLGDRDGVRTPMQWGDGPNAAFSKAEPARLMAQAGPNRHTSMPASARSNLGGWAGMGSTIPRSPTTGVGKMSTPSVSL